MEYITLENKKEWNTPYSRFKVHTTYEWLHKPTGKTGRHQIRTMTIQDARKLISYWNNQVGNIDWLYTLIEL